MKSSLVISVLNESGAISAFLETISKQSLLPSEIIFIDGGSSDDTVKKIKQWSKKLPILLFTKPGAGIATSRNYGIKKASGDNIAVTDVCLLDPDWFREVSNPLQNQQVSVTGGFFRPAAHNLFTMSLAAVTIPTLSEINPSTFLPSSRSVAFRKSAWEKIGGYPEWLPICEDLVFDIELKKAGFKFAFAPRAIAYWEPRSSVQKFFKQYYFYARGDGHAHLWIKRHLIRYATYLFLAFSIAALFFGIYWPLGLALIGGLLYTSKLYRRFQSHFPEENGLGRIASAAYIPALLFIGDMAKMIGFPVGLKQRAARQIDYERF